MNKSTLSICIPTYNRSSYLIKTVEAFLKQDRTIEINISDNASTDDTQQRILDLKKKYKKLNINYIRHSSNIGFDRNLLSAVKLSSKQYCWTISDDDLPTKGAIRILEKIIKKNDRVALIHLNYSRFDNLVKKVTAKKMVENINKDTLFKNQDDFFFYPTMKSYFKFLGTNTITLSTNVVKRSYWTESLKHTKKYIGHNFIHSFIIADIIKAHPNIFYVANPIIQYLSNNHRLWPNDIWKDYNEHLLNFLIKLGFEKNKVVYMKKIQREYELREGLLKNKILGIAAPVFRLAQSWRSYFLNNLSKKKLKNKPNTSRSFTLVTGGAGYIGSHFIYEYLKKNDNLIIIDNLEHGFLKAIDSLKKNFSNKIIIFEEMDLRNRDRLEKIFKEHDVSLVVHFAALCVVGQSVKDPGMYFSNNIGGSISLLNTMAKYNCRQLIFSSSAAVYGESKYLPVDEVHPKVPVDPYGLSKLVVEEMLRWYDISNSIRSISLRYFNVCGSSKNRIVGFSSIFKQNKLVQDAVKGALGIYPLHLTYSNVKTRDGSPVRDYVDVVDLAKAHLKAIAYLKRTKRSNQFNLGTGKGYSVKEIISIVEKVLKVKLDVQKGQPRKGEYAEISASNRKAYRLLNWKPEVSIEESVTNLANWFKSYPNGFSE